MNVLLIGGGGREHALAWALKKSPRVETLWCSPGNAGIDAVARGVPLDLKDGRNVLSFLKEQKIGLTVVGPEAPLVEGLADLIRKDGGAVFGPGREAAQLEGSKIFAKRFMTEHGIPTADYREFSDLSQAVAFVESVEWKEPFRVVKADGLAAGKGVFVCKDRAGVLEALRELMDRKAFGSAGARVVIEELLEGDELSVMAFCDGKTLRPLPPSQDHKRIGDGDQGPNTGGMGAYAPVPFVTGPVWESVRKRVFEPFLKGLRERNLRYEGVIYFGIMVTESGPKILEFNVRFGDPETQAVLPLMENDLFDVIQASVGNRLHEVELRVKSGAAVCVVLASGGYPGDYEKGQEISGLDRVALQEDVAVFHAGTVRRNDRCLTAGGRVLGVTGLGPDLETACRRAYAAARSIRFDGIYFRKDIAAKALKTASGARS
ncbi:MAG TPA: phosphoribosylamine--glycine ligase [Elusimicrobiota bacterium]|nr:phosphoribosylamine--glycine ligase [Elusimicrobiota bacterium]